MAAMAVSQPAGGHYQIVTEQYRGPLTMVVGVGMCCMCCLPCGFLLELDTRQKQIFVPDPSPKVNPAMFGAPTVVATPSPQKLVQTRCVGPCGETLQVDVSAVPPGSQMDFPCPRCGTRNRVTSGTGSMPPAMATMGGMSPTMGGIQSAPMAMMTPVELPHWWRSQPPMGDSILASVPNDHIEDMQRLFDRTWKDITTRDRAFAKPPRLQVVQVQQNCNPALWQRYVAARKEVRSRGNGSQVECGTSAAMQEENINFGALEADVNEFFLFHGTRPSACDNISKVGFTVDLAGSHTGTLYGPGVYLSENSSKSDEYASDDASGIYRGLYAMMLCRVTCGRMLYTAEVKPDTQELVRQVKSGGYDSVLGDREKARGTYREYVVYDSRQIYPELVVIYRREPRED